MSSGDAATAGQGRRVAFVEESQLAPEMVAVKLQVQFPMLPPGEDIPSEAALHVHSSTGGQRLRPTDRSLLVQLPLEHHPVSSPGGRMSITGPHLADAIDADEDHVPQAEGDIGAGPDDSLAFESSQKAPLAAKRPRAVSMGMTADQVQDTFRVDASEDSATGLPILSLSSLAGLQSAPPATGKALLARIPSSPEVATKAGLTELGMASPLSEKALSPGQTQAQAAETLASRQTAFSLALATATLQAPDQLADKLITRLKEQCIEEATVGHSCCVWETALPGGRRFSDAVGRAFAGHLQALAFWRLEWWSGKEWKDMPGRYCVVHDTIYDKCSMRIRVQWPTASSRVDGRTDECTASASHSGGLLGAVRNDPNAELLEQVQEVLALQQQLLLMSAAAEANAEERARRAEERATAAEQRLLQVLKQSPSPVAGAGMKNPPAGDASTELVPDLHQQGSADGEEDESGPELNFRDLAGF